MSNILPTRNFAADKELASRAGKANKGKKHFATEVLDKMRPRAKKNIPKLYFLCLERQIQIQQTCKLEKRGMTSDESREFDALSKITNKYSDKLLPSLQESDINVNEFSKIEVVNLTSSTLQIPSIISSDN